MSTQMSTQPEYTLEVVRHASDIPRGRHAEVIDLLNGIIGTNWNITTPHWSAADSPFHANFGLIFVRHANDIVGFSVYRRLAFGGMPVIYRSGTEILPEQQ